MQSPDAGPAGFVEQSAAEDSEWACYLFRYFLQYRCRDFVWSTSFAFVQRSEKFFCISRPERDESFEFFIRTRDERRVNNFRWQLRLLGECLCEQIRFLFWFFDPSLVFTQRRNGRAFAFAFEQLTVQFPPLFAAFLQCLDLVFQCLDVLVVFL